MGRFARWSIAVWAVAIAIVIGDLATWSLGDLDNARCLAQAAGDGWSFCIDTDVVNVVALWVVLAVAALLQAFGVATLVRHRRAPPAGTSPDRSSRAAAPFALATGSIAVDLAVGVAATATVLVAWPGALGPSLDPSVSYVVFVGVMALYECLMLSLGARRTIGMRVSGLDVVDARTSEPLSPLRASARGALLGASCGFVPPIGLIATALATAVTRPHRTLHDLGSRSALVRSDVRARVAPAHAQVAAAAPAPSPLQVPSWTPSTSPRASLRAFSVGLWLLTAALAADDVAALVVARHAHTACLLYAPDPCADVSLPLQLLLVGIVVAAACVQVGAEESTRRRLGETRDLDQGSDSASATISLGPDGQST